MPDEGEAAELPMRPSSPPKIEPWVRTVCAVLGLGAMGAGGVAVFTRDVEAGPVALLLLLGALFFLIALRGQWPNRIKAGENEATWVGEFLGEVFDSGTAQTKEEIVERVSQPDVPPEVSTPVLAAAAYEGLVLDTLRREVGSGRASAYLTEPRHRPQPDAGYDDEFVYRESGRRILIEVRKNVFRNGSRGTSHFLSQLTRWLEAFADQDVEGILVVSDHLPRQAVLRFVDKLEELKPTIRVVMPEFRGTEDREQLVQALWQVAQIPSTDTEEVPAHG